MGPHPLQLIQVINMISIEALRNMEIPNQTIVITGANSGIGFEAAKFLAVKGAHVIMGVRSLVRGDEALALIEEEVEKPRISVLELDLSSLKSIEAFVAAVKKTVDSVDVLINNAGIMAVKEGKTQDGFERQLGINHLGHFALTAKLFDHLSLKARIVNVSSQAHLMGSFDFDNLQYENGGYKPFKAYAQSKLANITFTHALNDKLKDKSIQAITVHPGVAKTGLFGRKDGVLAFRLFSPLMGLFAQPASIGALPTIAAAVHPSVTANEFLGPKEKGHKGYLTQNDRINPRALDKKTQAALWQASETLTGVTFPL
jgi:NAD(P)-dependent dehydrogenase (short-subunit alcohol dehydrogenase family)